jgi:hypothetical protein
MSVKRQKLLYLYLGNSSPASNTIGWSLFDGTGKSEPSPIVDEEPPYQSALEAMRDGWRVIQVPTLTPHFPGQEYNTDYLRFEYILEKLEDCDA